MRNMASSRPLPGRFAVGRSVTVGPLEAAPRLL